MINIYIQIKDKVLGQGNFGKVCLATVSNKLIRAETDMPKDMSQDLSLNDNAAIQNTTSRLKSRLSMRRNPNNYVANNNKAKKSFDSDNVDNELNEPLLTKDEKRIKAAVKMVKGN